MDQPARCHCRSERRTPPAALPYRGPICAQRRPELVAPPHGHACRCSALLAASDTQHDTVARGQSAQPPGGDRATSTNLPSLRASARSERAHPWDAVAQLDGGWRLTCPICGAALEDFRLYT